MGRIEKSIILTKDLMRDDPTDFKKHFHIIEDLAWAVLNHKALVEDPTYCSALVAALITGDVKAITMLSKALSSSNFFVRYVAIKQAHGISDRLIQRCLVQRIKEEKLEPLRMELSKVLCKSRLHEAKNALEEILASSAFSSQEKGFAILSLCHLYPVLDKEALFSLMRHKKPIFRNLSIQLLKKKKVSQAKSYLKEFLDDPILSVRQSALNALIQYKDSVDENLFSQLRKLAQIDHPTIAIGAVLILNKTQSEYSNDLLSSCLESSSEEIRYCAAYLTGKIRMHDKAYIKSLFSSMADSFMRANLAISLFENGLRDEYIIKEIEDLLYDPTLIMMQDLNYCRVSILSKSKVSYTPQIQDYPKIRDLGVRLHLMNMLCVADSKKVLSLMKNFLKEKMWGVSASAAMLLIQEGPTHAIELVENLVDDKDQSIALQACLVLAFLKTDANVCNRLIEHYPKCSYQLKLTILEALGRLGDKRAINFLLERLEDPFQTTNIVAASSIIQCLYH